MAQIRLDLNQFKASGVYTLEYDMSENIVINTQTIRLIVGFSRKGPFNAPVYLPDKQTAKIVFGDIDPLLERRGSFFHRAIYTALDVGPVYGLNLLALNDDVTDPKKDIVGYQSFSIATTEPNGILQNELLSSFYNKERFWFPDQEYFLANVNKDATNKGKLLNVVNLSQTPVSILVKRAANLRQFNIPANEWFGTQNQEIPPFVDEYDLISDYFLEVTILQGDWSDYTKLSRDPVYNKYFSHFGLNKNYMKEFLSLPEVRVLGNFTGTIIPDLRDATGANFSLDVVVNSAIASTGVFFAIDKDALNNYDPVAALEDDFDNISAVDLVGHTLANTEDIVPGAGRVMPNSLNFLSYSFPSKPSFVYNEHDEDDVVVLTPGQEHAYGHSFDVDTYGTINGLNPTLESLFIGGHYGYVNNVISIPIPDITSNDYDSYSKFKNSIVLNKSLVALNSEVYGNNTTSSNNIHKFAIIRQMYETNGKLKLIFSHKKNITQNDFVIEGTNDIKLIKDKDANTLTFDFDNLPDWYNSALDADFEKNFNVTITYDNKLYFYTKAVDKLSGTEIELEFTNELQAIFKDGSNALKNEFDVTKFKFYFGVIQTEHSADVEGTILIPYGFVISDNNYKFKPIIVSNPNVFSNKSGEFFAYTGTSIYKDYQTGVLIDGTYAKDGSNDVYFGYNLITDYDGIDILKITSYDTSEPITENGIFVGYRLDDENSSFDFDGGVLEIFVIGQRDIFNNEIKLYETIIYDSVNPDGSKFTIDKDYHSKLQTSDYVVSQVDYEDELGNSQTRYKLSKILTKRRITNQAGNIVYEYTVNQPVYKLTGQKIVKFNDLDELAQSYRLFSLKGFKLTDYHLPGGLNKVGQLEKILGVLDPVNTNLTEVLKDREIIQFRYIVDTFDGGLAQMTYPKTYLTRLAKERQKCLAIMNAPSMTEFAKSNDPIFTKMPTDTNPKPILDTAYIAAGGNQDVGASFLFSLPDEFNGSKFAGYFGPFLKVRENGRNILIPPAADVSNLFIRKFINGTPFHIVAGPKRGVLSNPQLVGLEYDFLLKDREHLEPFGINPIIKKRNVGYMIYGNQMAYQRTKSAFNNLHVRDLLITIEDAIEDLLANYLFDFNNPTTRIEIKSRVDAYLDKVRSLDGIYTFETRMDDSNNGPEIIRENMGIIDIAIEPQMGFHKFINRIHVYSAGGIQSLGFDVQNVVI